MTREELKTQILAILPAAACEIEENTISQEWYVRTGCNYLDGKDIDQLSKIAPLVRIHAEGDQISIYYQR